MLETEKIYERVYVCVCSGMSHNNDGKRCKVVLSSPEGKGETGMSCYAHFFQLFFVCGKKNKMCRRSKQKQQVVRGILKSSMSACEALMC